MRLLLPIVLFFLFSCTSTQKQQIDLKDAEVYYNRGVAYVEKGENDQAVAGFTKAIEINPRFAKAYYYRGVIYAGRPTGPGHL